MIKRKLRSLYLTWLLDQRFVSLRRAWHEMRHTLLFRKRVVSVFMQLDDPYSYLLSAYLPALAEQYDIELHVYLSEALGDDYQPAPDMLAEYAVLDCKRVAAELGLPFLDRGTTPPVNRLEAPSRHRSHER